MAWYNSSWDYRVKVTVDNTKVSADLTDFPIYIDLSDLPAGFHTNVNQTDARDIRVTTSDGTTEIPREVVSYDSSGDTGELHFKGDILNSTDVDFYIYYSNSSATEPASDATYGRDNVWTQYEAVYHMNEDPTGTVIDSTGNGYGLTSSGSMTSGDLVTATVGNGIDFDGSDDEMVSSGNHGLLTGSTDDNVWISCIVNNYSQTGTDRWITLGSYVGLFTFTSTSWGIQSNGDNSGDNAASQLDSGVHHLAGLFDAGTEYKGWTDGTQVFQKNITDTESASAPITIGDGYGSGNNTHVTALLDEVRISGNNLGTSWAPTENNNLTSPSTFYSLGAEEGLSGNDNSVKANIVVTETNGNSVKANISSILNTGWLSPGTVVNDSSDGSLTWSNPSNAENSDDTYATASGDFSDITYFLKLTNLEASIPSGATITGIEVSVEAKNTSTPLGIFYRVSLVDSDGSILDHDKSTGSTLTESDVLYTYGGSSDLWSETWTRSDINDSDFGVVVQFQEKVGGPA